MIIFRIRSKTTGEFSKGGTRPSFSKKGKIWTGTGPLALHFNQIDRIGKETYRRLDCEVVAYELTETECYRTSIEDHINLVNSRKAEREALSKQRYEEWQRKYRQEEYEKLKKEFDPT